MASFFVNKSTLKISLSVVSALLIIGVTQIHAQSADAAHLSNFQTHSSITMPAAQSPFSLLDLSRIRWNQSYGVMYSSGSAGSGSYGMYTNSFLYEFSPKLSLAFDVGIGHNPGVLFNKNQSADAHVFPSFNFDYHPSSKFRLSVGFASVPGPYLFGSPYTSGWNRWGTRDYSLGGANSYSGYAEPVDSQGK